MELPAALAGRPGTLRLGPVNDSDRTYVNGVLIGEQEDTVDAVREYGLPAGVLRGGRNVVAVRIVDRLGRGGIWGDPEGVYLEAGSRRIPLAGEWRYRIEEEWLPGKQPEFRADVSLARQFLRHHNPLDEVLARPAPAGAAPGVAGTAEDGPEGGVAADEDVLTIALAVVAAENRYDRDVLTVRAGQRVRLVFDNTDDMRHNVLVVEPGSLQEIGARVDDMLQDPTAGDRGYIPESDVILFGLPLVEPRQTAVLTFTAPSEPGEYPYVCTFPGHWRTMQGVMKVVP